MRIKNTIIITITLMAVIYMVGFIADIPFLPVTSLLVGGMIWCVAGIWLSAFLLANFADD